MLFSLSSALLVWFCWADSSLKEQGKPGFVFCTERGERLPSRPQGGRAGGRAEGGDASVPVPGVDAHWPARGCSWSTVSARQFWGADLAFHHHRENRSPRPCLKSDAVRWDEADSFLSANWREPNVNQLLKTKIMLSPPWFRNDSQSGAAAHCPHVLCLWRVSLIYFIL